MTVSAPLTPAERARIRRWQRHMFVYYGIAMIMLALAAGLTALFFEMPWVRRAALGMLLVLVIAATLVQFRERCPRCGMRLGSQGRLFLPERCRGCGIAFDAAT
jgi:hypothetical protein